MLYIAYFVQATYIRACNPLAFGLYIQSSKPFGSRKVTSLPNVNSTGDALKTLLGDSWHRLLIGRRFVTFNEVMH